MEATKSSWSSLFLLEVVLAVALLSYWCFPVTMNLLQVITIWFDWFILVLNNLFYIFVLLNTLIVLLIYISFHKPTGKPKSDLFDEYVAAVPTVEYNCFREIKPAFQAVKIVEENNCYDCQVMKETVHRGHIVSELKLDQHWEESSKSYHCEVVEETQHSIHRVNHISAKGFKFLYRIDSLWEKESTKTYRRTEMKTEMKTEKKKKKKKMGYSKMESEIVTKTSSSWRSESFDGLSSEDFQTTVETFIKEKNLFRDNGVFLRDNDAVDQWQNGVVQMQGSCGYASGRQGQRGRSSHRLVGGSGSNGYGSYLTISPNNCLNFY